MSTNSNNGSNRLRSQSRNETTNNNYWVPAASFGVAAIGAAGAAFVTKIASNVLHRANPFANAAEISSSVEPVTDMDVDNAVDGDAANLNSISRPVCQCKECVKCKFLTSLKNYGTALQTGTSKIDILKQVVEGLCHDYVDLTDEDGTDCFVMALRTQDLHVIQAVMAFWPVVFRRRLDRDIEAIDSELMTRDYSQAVHYVWKMVSDPFPLTNEEDFVWAGIPKELIPSQSHVTTINAANPVEKGVRLLAVDGGGTRGLILLELLAQIEKRTGKPIAESFDWLCGTSTGGIIILFLALNKHLVEDCRKLYFRLKDEVFTGRKPYDSLKFEKLLQEYFPPDQQMKDIEGIKIVITTVTGTINNLELQLFTNYDSSRFTPIWEVARMTSAAPSFFQPYQFPAGSKKFYYDGGLMANNPTQEMCSEVKLFDSLENATVVSLGAGWYDSGEQVSLNIDASLLGSVRMALSGEVAKLVRMLTNLVGKTDGEKIQNMVTLATTARCFYARLTPILTTKLELDETDNGKLVNAVWHTKVFAHFNRNIFEDIAARL